MDIETKRHVKNNASIDNHIGCFGEFNFADSVCRHQCAVNLRCAIETEQNVRYEMLEDFIEPSSFPIIFQ